MGSNTWKEYPFIPNEIELTNLWKSKNINSDLEKLPSKTTIKSVSSDGRVVVVYKYDRKIIFYLVKEQLFLLIKLILFQENLF